MDEHPFGMLGQSCIPQYAQNLASFGDAFGGIERPSRAAENALHEAVLFDELFVVR